MSAQTRWPSLFKRAEWGAVVNGGPVRELITAGELGPADLAADTVLHYLRQDATLRAVFKDRLNRTMWPSPNDARTFPRLGVYLASAASSERPTATSVEQTSVFVGTFWDAKDAAVVEDGEPTVATVISHIKRVLRAVKARVLVVWNGNQEKQLAHDLTGIGAESFGDLRQVNGRAYGVFHELEFQYRLHVDKSGALVNLL